MRDWRQALQRWVTNKDFIASLAKNKVEYWAWDIRVPSSGVWPAPLPTCQAITDFYQNCDGGNVNWFQLSALSQISELNHTWFRLLSNYDKRGDVLLPKRHVVIAVDAGGAPVIWDAVTNHVAAFFWKGGDWEPPLASSIEDFFATLFNPKEDGGWWDLFLRLLDTL